jgi:hypothetical protein
VFTASGGEPPAILGEGVSSVTSTDATLEATIEPRAGRNAHYQFQLAKSPAEFAPEFTCPTEGPRARTSLCLGITRKEGALPIDWICGECEIEPAARPVSLDLASEGELSLEPNTTYHFRVIAARSVQTVDTIQWEEPTVFGADQTFTTPATTGATPQQQSSGSTAAPESPQPSLRPHHKRHRLRHHRRHRRKTHRA